MPEAKKVIPGNRELGLKLLTFRNKLAFSIGQKKITQQQFAEMFNVSSGRTIASYELGDSEPPASLFYRIWQHGNSIDNIFSEGPITDAGRDNAKALYEKSSSTILKSLNRAEKERVLKTLEDNTSADNKHTHADKKVIEDVTGSGKERHSTTRKIKKR